MQLEDPKNSKYDLTFCPIQSFESDSVAKDFAALLALFHFQKNLPLERKLPEPYATTWLQMITAEKEKEKGNIIKASSDKQPSLPTSSVLPPPPASCRETEEHDNISFKKKSTTAAVIDPNTADWLCEKCGNQNFNKLQSGAPRLKCFRCSALRTEACILVTPNTLSTSTSTSSLSSTTPASAKGPEQSKVRKVSAPPTAVADLRARDVFASKAAASRVELEQIAKRKKQRAYFDALNRANRPMAVFLSPSLRKELERVLGMEVTSAPSSDCAVNTKEFIADFAGIGFVPSSACKVSVPLQLELLEHVVSSLVQRGFSEGDVLRALLYVHQASGEIEEDFLSNEESSEDLLDDDTLDDPASANRFKFILAEASVRYLCTYLDEHSLPAEFNPTRNEAKPGLKVIAAAKTSTSHEAQKMESISVLVASNSSGDSEADNLLQSIYQDSIQEVGQFGWSDDKILAVLSALHGTFQVALSEMNNHLVSTEFVKTAIIFFLLETSKICFGLSEFTFGERLRSIWLSLKPELDNSANKVDILSNDFLKEECEALHAILDDKLSISSSIMSMRVELDMSLLSESLSFSIAQLPCVIQVYFPPQIMQTYPELEPIVLLKPQNSNNNLSRMSLLILQILLWRKCLQLRGEQMLFQLYSFVQDGMKGDEDHFLDNLKSIPIDTLFKSSLEKFSTLIFSENTVLVKNDYKASGDISCRELNEIEAHSIEPSSSKSNSTSMKRKMGRSTHPFWKRMERSQIISKSCGSPIPSKSRQALPAWKSRQEFLDLYSSKRALVVTGETGCGKTTQIPQFIFEENPNAKIIVCQPRR